MAACGIDMGKLRAAKTQSMSNHEITAYLEPRLGSMFRGVYDVAGEPGDMSGGPFCFVLNTHPSPQPGHWVLRGAPSASAPLVGAPQGRVVPRQIADTETFKVA
eukprot:COSAG02_NODE_15792_length_1140_cov_10.516811_1_plen_104_part_00